MRARKEKGVMPIASKFILMASRLCHSNLGIISSLDLKCQSQTTRGSLGFFFFSLFSPVLQSSLVYFRLGSKPLQDKKDWGPKCLGIKCEANLCHGSSAGPQNSATPIAAAFLVARFLFASWTASPRTFVSPKKPFVGHVPSGTWYKGLSNSRLKHLVNLISERDGRKCKYLV